MAGYSRKPATEGPDPLSGKREAPRKSRSLFVTCLGSGGELNGRTIDLSRGGMLLEIRDRTPTGTKEPAGIIPFAARVADLYPMGMAAVFGDGAVKVHAAVVRVASHPTDPKAMRLGCRFDTPLTDAQCHLLGLDASLIADATLEIPTEDGAPTEALAPTEPAVETEPLPTAPPPAAAPRADSFPLAPPAARTPAAAPSSEEAPWGDQLARIGRRNAEAATRSRPVKVARGTVLVHLFSRTGPLMGPRFVGTLSSVKGRSLIVQLVLPDGETDAVGYAAILGGAARAVLLRDGRVLWDVQTRVEFVTVLDGADEVALLTLLAARLPPAAIRRLEAARPVSPAA